MRENLRPTRDSEHSGLWCHETRSSQNPLSRQLKCKNQNMSPTDSTGSNTLIECCLEELASVRSAIDKSCRAWSRDTLEEPPHWVVDADQKTPTPMSHFSDRSHGLRNHQWSRTKTAESDYLGLQVTCEQSTPSRVKRSLWLRSKPRGTRRRPFLRIPHQSPVQRMLPGGVFGSQGRAACTSAWFRSVRSSGGAPSR